MATGSVRMRTGRHRRRSRAGDRSARRATPPSQQLQTLQPSPKPNMGKQEDVMPEEGEMAFRRKNAVPDVLTDGNSLFFLRMDARLVSKVCGWGGISTLTSKRPANMDSAVEQVWRGDGDGNGGGGDGCGDNVAMANVNALVDAAVEEERGWKGKPRPIHTLKELASLLRAEFEGRNSVSAERLQALMAAYQPTSRRDWKPFAKFERCRYTRNLVDEGDGRYNLMLLCWAEGNGSAVHDHSGAHCIMRMLSGSLCEVRFAWPTNLADAGSADEGQPLQEIGKTTLENGDVCYINDSLGLHRVENPSHSEKAVSLHLYCPPFNSCGIFNQRTGHRSIGEVTFWSRPGDTAAGRVRRRDRPQPPAEDN